ncbi:MAG: Cell division protein FtsH (EC [uncultured Campylobacterales bacterium]|uniref:ATP-dependent zinc metalloprotease FtsH n=1 Tax=uncultured Campylobacterales bacterium TaxID=352960 RepID=A0A6S6T0V0_9BACT|nr:MAG: Cell division protein FtsH (EC [uncultured Campylobacterales bacterium]
MSNKRDDKQNKDKNNNFFEKNPLLVFLIISTALIFLFKNTGLSDSLMSKGNIQRVEYSKIKSLISENEVNQVSIGKTSVKAKSGNGLLFVATKVDGDSGLVKLLDEKKIPYTAIDDKNYFLEFFFNWILPIGLFLLIWSFVSKKMQKNMGGGLFGMGSSKKMINAQKPKTKFEDMAGCEEAKDEVKEIVDFLKNPDRYISLGAKIPKGVLLVGPPGTGKTLLARAVAGEANVPFFSVSGSSFIEMFVGVGASRVRDLFQEAQKEAPSIIFIDEIDAIGKSRASSGNIGGNDEREQTLNQLLAEMDGFASTAPIIVLAATNRPEVLDAALLRPGRFDRQVLVDKPDIDGRVAILKIHSKDVKLGVDIDFKEIAKMTVGLSGADLANIINEGALLAGRENKKSVSQKDFVEAIERVSIGLEKKGRRIREEEKKIVAYHESGHALISEITKGSEKTTQVSIVPRGMAALGYTAHTPEENKYLAQKHELIAKVDVLLGGRAAEEVFLGEISTGASNDLERTTDILKSMIGIYGMTDVAGLMVLEERQNSFIGGGGTSKNYSESLANKQDEYIKSFLSERYEHVKGLLGEYKDAIESIVAKLYEDEKITGDELRNIISAYEIANEKPSKLVKREA